MMGNNVFQWILCLLIQETSSIFVLLRIHHLRIWRSRFKLMSLIIMSHNFMTQESVNHVHNQKIIIHSFNEKSHHVVNH